MVQSEAGVRTGAVYTPYKLLVAVSPVPGLDNVEEGVNLPPYMLKVPVVDAAVEALLPATPT